MVFLDDIVIHSPLVLASFGLPFIQVITWRGNTDHECARNPPVYGLRKGRKRGRHDVANVLYTIHRASDSLYLVLQYSSHLKLSSCLMHDLPLVEIHFKLISVTIRFMKLLRLMISCIAGCSKGS